MCKALDVAKWMISLSSDAGDTITNLKLQKLLYYAQAWHLVLNDGKELFSNKIEAWVHGPVVPSVYVHFKPYGIRPIECSIVKKDKIPAAIKEHLLSILQVFGGYSAYQLELMTHSEEPWKNARKGLPPDKPSHNVISTSDMYNFYSRMLQEHEQEK